MNHDDFETKLQSLADALHRPDPTAAWKSEILGAANAARTAAPSRSHRLPYWLLASWAVCWVAALTLHFMTPDTRGPALAESSTNAPAVKNTEWTALAARKEAIEALLARNDLTLSNTRP